MTVQNPSIRPEPFSPLFPGHKSAQLHGPAAPTWSQRSQDDIQRQISRNQPSTLNLSSLPILPAARAHQRGPTSSVTLQTSSANATRTDQTSKPHDQNTTTSDKAYKTEFVKLFDSELDKILDQVSNAVTESIKPHDQNTRISVKTFETEFDKLFDSKLDKIAQQVSNALTESIRGKVTGLERESEMNFKKFGDQLSGLERESQENYAQISTQIRKIGEDITRLDKRMGTFDTTIGHMVEEQMRSYFRTEFFGLYGLAADVFCRSLHVRRMYQFETYLTQLAMGSESIRTASKRVIDEVMPLLPRFLQALESRLGCSGTNPRVDVAADFTLTVSTKVQESIKLERARISSVLANPSSKPALNSNDRALSCLQSYFKGAGRTGLCGKELDDSLAKSSLPVMLLIWDTDNSVFQESLEVDMRGLAMLSKPEAAMTEAGAAAAAGAGQVYEIDIAECKKSTRAGMLQKARAQLVLRLRTVERYLRLAGAVPPGAGVRLRGNICYAQGTPQVDQLPVEQDGVQFAYWKAEMGLDGCASGSESESGVDPDEAPQ